MVVIDGAAQAHINTSKHSKKFNRFCESELREKCKRIAVPVDRLDLVLNVYHEDSLKAETWEKKRECCSCFCEIYDSDLHLY